MVSNSYGKPYIKLMKEYAAALAYEKQVNFCKRIYGPQDKNEPYPTIRKMFARVYDKLLEDFVKETRVPPFSAIISTMYAVDFRGRRASRKPICRKNRTRWW